LRIVFILVFVILATNLFSFGRREKVGDSQDSQNNNVEAAETAENIIKILGKIQIYGNEPHTFAGIVDEDGNEYAIYPSFREDELRGLQGHLIDFTVILLDEPRGYGSLFLRGGTVTPLNWEIIR
jgi:hypothetical protein